MRRKLPNKPIIAILLFFACATSPLLAQQFAFKVLGVKGEVTANGQALKVGSMVQASQKLVLGQGAYLGLAHHTNKTLEISKAGEYAVSELDAKIAQAPQSLASKYAQFVVDELTDDKGSSRFHSRAKTGSVTRDVLQQPILFMMPIDNNGISRTTRVLSDSKIAIRWYMNESAATEGQAVSGYTLLVKESNPEQIGKVIFEAQLDEPYFEMDLADARFKQQKRLFYQVVAHTNSGELKSEELAIEKIKARDAETIRAELAQLGTEHSALGYLVNAKYFEDKGLVANAMYMYEQALGLSEAPSYAAYYQQFLYTHRLSADSRSATLAAVE